MRTIKRQTIYEQVLEHLQDYIISHELRPGDRLPSEMELAAMFRISRHSVRSAVKVLESVGVIETRAGDGSRLRETNVLSLTEHLRFIFALDGATFEEMAFARNLIECALLPVVAQKAEEEDFQRLEATIEVMRENMNNIDVWLQADMEFHQALTAAAKNRILVGLGVMVQEFFSHVSHDAFPTEEAEKLKSIEDHVRICQALREKNGEAAQTMMREHLSVYP